MILPASSSFSRATKTYNPPTYLPIADTRLSAGLLNYTRKRYFGSHGNYVAMNHAEMDRQSRRVVYSPSTQLLATMTTTAARTPGIIEVASLRKTGGGGWEWDTGKSDISERSTDIFEIKNRVVQYFRPIPARYLFGVCSLPAHSS